MVVIAKLQMQINLAQKELGNYILTDTKTLEAFSFTYYTSKKQPVRKTELKLKIIIKWQQN